MLAVRIGCPLLRLGTDTNVTEQSWRSARKMVGHQSPHALNVHASNGPLNSVRMTCTYMAQTFEFQEPNWLTPHAFQVCIDLAPGACRPVYVTQLLLDSYLLRWHPTGFLSLGVYLAGAIQDHPLSIL